MYLPNASPLLDLFRIHYVVPHVAQDLREASLFQGFSPAVIQNATIMHHISLLPREILELFIDQADIPKYRVMRGAYSLFPLELSYFSEFLEQLEPEFCCVFSSDTHIAQSVKQVLDSWPAPVLHITPAGTPFGLPEGEMNAGSLRDYAVEVVDHWEASGTFDLPAQMLRSSLRDGDAPSKAPLAHQPYGHFVTLPNEVALTSVGFELSKRHERPLVGVDNDPYLEAIHKSVTAVREQRNEVFRTIHPAMRGLVPYDTILTVPSVYKHSTTYEKRLKETLPEPVFNKVRDILRQIVRRDTYNMIGNPRNASSVLSTPEVQSLLSQRTDELFAYTSALSVRASSNLVPVIRLPPSTDNIRPELINLAKAATAKTGSPHQRKLSDTARKLSEKLSAGLPEWVFEELRGSHGVKLVADAPLEWLPLDGLPLALRVDCSRIPTTPGDLYVQEMVAKPEVIIPTTAFDEVLVVRSFKDNDPLRKILTQAVQMMSESFESNKPKIRFVDVRTKDELLAALNSFSGAMLVYDGHGKHDETTDIGALSLAGEDVDAWELRGARIPPVVVLSACSTHAFLASHATTANGFLAAGAYTVLGTALPVNGLYSGLFVARLMLRLNSFMPILLNRPQKSFRWSEMLPGLQRRQYASEVLWTLNGLNGIRFGNEVITEIMLETGMAIDTGEYAWYEVLMRKTAELTNFAEGQLRDTARREAYLTDALLYIQLGNPDRVIVADPPEAAVVPHQT